MFIWNPFLLISFYALSYADQVKDQVVGRVTGSVDISFTFLLSMNTHRSMLCSTLYTITWSHIGSY